MCVFAEFVIGFLTGGEGGTAAELCGGFSVIRGLDFGK